MRARTNKWAASVVRDYPDLPELEEAYADEVVDMCGQRHRTVNEKAKISD